MKTMRWVRAGVLALVAAAPIALSGCTDNPGVNSNETAGTAGPAVGFTVPDGAAAPDTTTTPTATDTPR